MRVQQNKIISQVEMSVEKFDKGIEARYMTMLKIKTVYLGNLKVNVFSFLFEFLYIIWKCKLLQEYTYKNFENFIF